MNFLKDVKWAGEKHSKESIDIWANTMNLFSKFKTLNLACSSLIRLTIYSLLLNSLLATAIQAQSLSSVTPELAVNVPVVQIGSDFYDITLELVGDDWAVTAASPVNNPTSIAANYSQNTLNILCLEFEGATYEILMDLKDLDTATFELTSIVDVSMSTSCQLGFAVDSEGHGPDLSFVKTPIVDAINREAICNDGSEAVFYFRAAHTPSTNWLIHLQGGGDCSDEDTCSVRAQVTVDDVAEPETFLPFTSSLDYPATLDREGILSPNLLINPQFGTFNQVYIPYCSSDSHYGDRDASIDTFDFNFKGARIIQAIVEDLSSLAEPATNTLANSELVVISGTSAGGRGVQQNLDRIAAQISHENVFGVMDSSYFDRFFLTDEERIGLSMRQSDLWNAQYDDSCLTMLGEEDKHLCDRVELMNGYIETPFFIHMDQLDETAIGPNSDQAEEFAEHIRTALANQCGLFSGMFAYHGTLDSNFRFFESPVGGYSIHDVLINWLSGADESITRVIDGGEIVSCQ